MGTLRIGNGWLGFIQVFHMVSNTSDIQLAYSRDGRNWHRLAAGVPWMTTGPAGSWDEFQMYVPRVIPHGDEMWVYYGGASCHHDWWIVGQCSQNFRWITWVVRGKRIRVRKLE